MTLSSIQAPSHPAIREGFIDIARGLAILGVIAVHQSQSVPGISPALTFLTGLGQFGVQLFFVASAYTLCQSLENRIGQNNWIRKFYIRRWFRIAPLYFFGIALYAALSLARVYIDGDDGLWRNYTPSAVLANIGLIHGFIPEANNTIVPGGWSIGAEVAFYAVFPALWVLAKSENGGISTAKSAILVFIALIANLAFQMSAWMLSGAGVANNNFLYFNIVNQMPVFCIGIFAYSVRDRWFARDIKVLSGCIAFSPILIVAATLLNLNALYAVIPAIAAVLFAAFVLLLRSRQCTVVWLEAIGVRSYSIYMFHIIFAWFVSRAVIGKIGILPIVGPDGTFVVFFIGTVVATYGVAILTEAFIERRGTSVGSRLARRVGTAAA